MYHLTETLDDFISCLKQEKIPTFNSQGYWSFTPITRITSKKRNLLQLAQHYRDFFDEIEKIPISFCYPQKINFSKVIEACSIIEELLANSNFPEAEALIFDLKRRRIGLLYRLEQVNDGLDRLSCHSEVFQQLITIATEWKENQEIFWNKNLSSREKNRLEEVCCYAAFFPLLYENTQLKNAFFNWTLRENLPVAPFVEFPGMQKKLIEIRLSPRIGRLGGDSLQIFKQFNSKKKDVEKILVIPIEGQLVNILDEQVSVSLEGNYSLKLKDIFKIFKNKPYECGNLEYFAQGITNWNAHRLGWWNAKTGTYELIDLDQPDWWFQLPLFEVLSLSEARRRYGSRADGEVWIIIAKASREFMTLHYDKNHAYLEIAVPIGGRAYAIYDFGKVATHFPATNWEEVVTFTITVLATIAYPDENVFFSHRQHVGYCFEMEADKALRLMNHIKQDMELSRRGNMVFQIESENCGHWIQLMLEENLEKDRVPNLFRMQLIDTEPPKGWVAKTFSLIKKMPEYSRAKIIQWLHFPLGAWRGKWVIDRHGKKEWKSLNTNDYWQDGIIHLPARLHRTREMQKKLEDGEQNEDYFERID